jgi:hypothetical protein
MPRSDERRSDSDRTMDMYGTTLRTWDAATESWRIAWTNPVRGHHEEQIGRWNGLDILQEGTQTRQRGLSRRSFSPHGGELNGSPAIRPLLDIAGHNTC